MSKKTIADSAVFPIPDSGMNTRGLTKLELFTAVAMHGILASHPEHMTYENVGLFAVQQARSTIVALNNGEE